MSKKHHGGPGPVPPGNRQPQFGGAPRGDDDAAEGDTTGMNEDGFQNQDAQRRFGDFTGAGEPPIKQPTNLNDGTKRNK
jgi:hypothetical protein